jgi:NAD(P)-dependent dehydrogenase (short-subunit alcohol dehydrogenase family)
MREFGGRRYWLVGGSEGLGLALARALTAAGAQVVVSGRDAGRLAAVQAEMPGAEVQAMDVGSDVSVAEAAAAVGAVDGLVFLAGVYWPMAAQEIDSEKLVAMCNVNFTGCARVLGAVVPAMVARGAGHVVITGSLSGYRGLPGAMGYAASKAGVMSLAECLYADLRGTGVTVQLGSPGFIRTRLTAKNEFSMPFLMEADAAAAQMMRLMRGDRFSLAFPRVFAAMFRLGNFLPDWAYYRLFAPKTPVKAG